MRKVGLSILAALAVAVGLALPAAAEGGLPQLDAPKFPPQIVWALLTFAVLYVLMSRVALPRVGQVLEERQKRIDDNLGLAQSLKSDAEAAAAAYEKALADARARAQAILRESGEASAAEASKRQHDLQARLAEDIKGAEARILAAKEQAVGNVRNVAVDVARVATEKLIGAAVEAGAAEAAVDAALKERR
jgi:F-type H+-transporting ATPase subunit b